MSFENTAAFLNLELVKLVKSTYEGPRRAPCPRRKPITNDVTIISSTIKHNNNNNHHHHTTTTNNNNSNIIN